MRFLAFMILFIPSLCLGSAQGFEIESKKTGFLNVRKKATTKSTLITKLKKGTVIFSNSDSKERWISIVGFDKEKKPKIFYIINKPQYLKKIKQTPKLKALTSPVLVFSRPGISPSECSKEDKSLCPKKINKNSLIRLKHSELIETSNGWKLYYQIVFAYRDNTSKKLISGKGWVDSDFLSL